jgi:hypothetical protein
MSETRKPPSPVPHDWPRTTPGVLPPAVAAAAARPVVPARAPVPPAPAAPLQPVPRRPGADPASAQALPPLQEVFKGLDARELESQSVFDQLFGTPPDGGPVPPAKR